MDGSGFGRVCFKMGNSLGGVVQLFLPFVFLFQGKGPVEEQNFKMKVRGFLGVQEARKSVCFVVERVTSLF